MRIAVYAARDNPSALRNPNGDRVFLSRLIVGLRERGHEVEIVSSITDYNFRRGRLSVRSFIAECDSVRRRMRSFGPESWLIYNSTGASPDLFGWWQRPKRYVVLSTHARSNSPLPWGWRRLFAFAHDESLARADKVTVAHPTGIRSLLVKGVPPSKVSMLPLASEGWSRLPSKAQARELLDLPREASIILCVSRLTGTESGPGKTGGVMDLLAAMSGLPAGVVLVLVGDGPNRPRVQEAADRLEPVARVRLVGTIDHERLGWFYAACDIFAYADSSNLPRLSIVEAQICGRAVVAMRNASTEFAIEDGRTGLLASNLAEFRQHLAALAADRARCEAMGEAARVHATERHTMDARIRQVEGFLTRDVASAGRLAPLQWVVPLLPLSAALAYRARARRFERSVERGQKRLGKWLGARGKRLGKWFGARGKGLKRRRRWVGKRWAYLGRAVNERLPVARGPGG